MTRDTMAESLAAAIKRVEILEDENERLRAERDRWESDAIEKLNDYKCAMIDKERLQVRINEAVKDREQVQAVLQELLECLPIDIMARHKLMGLDTSRLGAALMHAAVVLSKIRMRSSEMGGGDAE